MISKGLFASSACSQQFLYCFSLVASAFRIIWRNDPLTQNHDILYHCGPVKNVLIYVSSSDMSLF